MYNQFHICPALTILKPAGCTWQTAPMQRSLLPPRQRRLDVWAHEQILAKWNGYEYMMYIYIYICRFPICFSTWNGPLSFLVFIYARCCMSHVLHLVCGVCVIKFVLCACVSSVLCAGFSLCYVWVLACVM